MPTFPLGKQITVYLSGYDFSSSNREYQADLTVGALDNTCFGTSFHKTNQPGLVEGEVSLKGYYWHTNPGATGYANVLKAAVRVDTPMLAVMNNPPVAGDLADLMIITAVARTKTVEVGEIITLESKFTGSNGLHVGNVIRPESAATWPSVSLDQGGASWVNDTTLYQYIVVLQVTAYTSGLAAVDVQTSPDNSAWTTRGTFPAITAIGGYALTLNAIMHRYVRINGAGTATLIAAFARIN